MRPLLFFQKTNNYRLSTLGLLSVSPTNGSPTNSQPCTAVRSLNWVNAKPWKELQNVLPNGNPFQIHNVYDGCRVGSMVALANP